MVHLEFSSMLYNLVAKSLFEFGICSNLPTNRSLANHVIVVAPTLGSCWILVSRVFCGCFVGRVGLL